MKKDDFKKSIDNINPDAYMGNRLKAKITADMPVRNNRRVTVSITAFCLAFAVVFGVAFLTPPTAPTVQTTTNNSGVENVKISPFIIVASAAEAEGAEAVTENKVLQLNEEYPYEMYLKVKDARGLSDIEKGELIDVLESELEKCYTENKWFVRMTEIGALENIVFAQTTFNEFKLDLEDTENIKSINVKNTSKYGQMVYNTNKPTFNAPEHGNFINIGWEHGNNLSANGQDFDFEKSSFYWDHTEEMDKAFNENINTPFSTFNDTITFTVEYNDGSKAIGVVDLVFDDSGNAKVVCRNYDYVA
ncbi:MAG: hypothetical protein E7556_03260 [Ruminococcaceae bacterium]|nr:hypothetical protein [Oscillospiraceae bacterium]